MAVPRIALGPLLTLACACACQHEPAGGDGSTGTVSTTVAATDWGDASHGSGTSTGTTAADTSSEGTSEGSTGEAPPDRVAIYVASGTSLYAFRLALDSGALEPLPSQSPGGTLGPLTHRDAVLHAARTEDLAIATLAIADDGTLAPLGSATVGLAAVYLQIDGPGTHLLLADFGANTIASHPRQPGDGAITARASATVAVGQQPHAIVLAPDGRFAVVPHLQSNELRVFAYDATGGALVPAAVPEVVAPQAGPRHLVFSDDATRAYLVDEVGDAITTWDYDAITGGLSNPRAQTTLPPDFDGADNTCADVHIRPGGATLYVSNRGHDSLAIFDLDAAGEPSPAGHVATAAVPRSFAIEPGGRWLVAAGQASGELAIHAIADDGQLAPALAPVAVPPEPVWVEAVAL